MINKIAGWLDSLSANPTPSKFKPTRLKSIETCVNYCLSNAPHGSEMQTIAKETQAELKLVVDGHIKNETKEKLVSLFLMARKNTKLNTNSLKTDPHVAKLFYNLIRRYKYFIVTDLEMTCVEQRGSKFQPETIEIGCAAVNTETLEIVDTFSVLVKPTVNPNLSEFCTKLTNITQSDIDEAVDFPTASKEFNEWLSKFDSSAFFAWGTGDHKQLSNDAKLHNIESPIAGLHIVNQKDLFKRLGFVKRGFGLSKALNLVGIEQMDAHRALPDAINTAKILPFMRTKAESVLSNQLTRRQVESYGKLLCLVLRHMPSKADVEIDDQGWCNILDLANGLQRQAPKKINKNIIKEVCFRDSGNRFQLSVDENMIRCLQGHSLAHVKINFEKVVPTGAIYHGTSEEHYSAINKAGVISKMDRNFVHLTSDIAKAISSGKRYGDPVVIQIDTDAMIRDGYNIYLAENGVYLADIIPAMYLKKIKHYHFTECGLDYVYLTDGFNITYEDGEEFVSFDDIDGIHQKLALDICNQGQKLTVKQFVFLRKELNLSKQELAKRLNCDGFLIDKFENGHAQLTESLDSAMRDTYLSAFKNED